MAEELSAGGHEQEEESALTESAPESAGPDASDTKLTPEDVAYMESVQKKRLIIMIIAGIVVLVLGFLAGKNLASLKSDARRGVMLTIGTIGFPAILLLFSLSRSFLLSMGLLLVMGFTFTWQNALANTLLQIASPDEMRGRVMSFYSMAFMGMVPCRAAERRSRAFIRSLTRSWDMLAVSRSIPRSPGRSSSAAPWMACPV